MKILVTGANGQLGNSLKRVLESRLPGVTDYVSRNELDITDRDSVRQVLSTGNYTHLINAAAYTAVDDAEEDKGLCSAVNVDGIKNLALEADEAGTKIIHLSTDYVFDGVRGCPYSEADKPNPLSHYGATKRKGETALIGLLPDAIIIRTGWLYSPFGKNFVKTILRKAQNGESLRIVSDQVGTPTSAVDLADAIVTILTSPKWIPGTYHFSNEGVASWYDFAKAITEISGFTTEITPITTDDYITPATRPLYSVLNKSLIKATYGLRIPYWRDSLIQILKEIKDNK